MLIDCHNCENQWDYGGEKEIGMQTNCPDCHYKVPIEPATPADVYAHRAPMLPVAELRPILVEDLVVDGLRDRMDAIHVYGSFIDPDAQLDYDDSFDEPQHPADASDLDVWIEVDAPATASTRFGGNQHGLLCRLASQGVLNDWGERAQEFETIPIDPTRELDDAIIETVRRAERATFSLTEQDAEILGFRVLDLTIGTRDAFEQEVGDDPYLTIWPE